MVLKVTVDSWPLLEWLYSKEPAARRFTELLHSAAKGDAELCMSRVNLGEVFYSFAKERSVGEAESILRLIALLPIEVVSVSDAHVDQAARWKASNRISYADGFVIALARERSSEIATGDPEFKFLQENAKVQLLWMGA